MSPISVDLVAQLGGDPPAPLRGDPPAPLRGDSDSAAAVVAHGAASADGADLADGAPPSEGSGSHDVIGELFGGPIAGRLMLGLWLLCFALLPALSGCGDDLGREPAEPYTDASQFPRQECVAGSLASLDPVGVFHGLATGDGRASSLSARIEGKAGALLGHISGRSAVSAEKTDDDLLVVVETDKSLRISMHLCGVLPSGELVGSYVICSSTSCAVSRLVGKRVVPLVEAPSHNLTLLGETTDDGAWNPAFAVNVRVKDGLAYVARYRYGLSIVDVRDPAAMVVLANLPLQYPDEEIYNDVKIVDGPGGKRYALMASNLVGVVVIDVTDPRAPVQKATFGAQPANLSPNVHTLAIDGTRAYLANTSTGLDIFDLADPLAPAKLGHFTHPAGRGYLHDLYVAEGRAYLNWWSAGMAVVDITDAAAPRLLANFQDYGQQTSHSSWTVQIGARKIALHGDEQYGAHLNLVDVTEGAAVYGTSIASWMTRPEVSIHNVMAMGHFAVLAYYQDGLRVLDLSDPEHPEQVAWFNTWNPQSEVAGDSFYEAATGVDVDAATSTIYVADIERGLLALKLASGI